MSGIAGVYNLDGGPADATLLRRMTDAASHRGSDRSGYWVDGSVGMGHRMFWTTPQSVLEKQPMTDTTNALCLVLDGRIDNREELISELQREGEAVSTQTDGEIVLRAYECWGDRCPVKLLGDFAFVIWDGRRRRLFCARDILGVRPFYYFFADHKFLFASELQQLLEAPQVPRDPNEGMIAEYLANAITDVAQTLFKNVFRLPPAHSLVIENGRLRTRRYWDVDLSKAIRYRSDNEYAEHFLELFRIAVHCRLRSHGRVGALLSGGIDSSSVVGMAQLLLDEGQSASSGFETFSLTFPGLSCDESHSIRGLVDLWGIQSTAVPLRSPAPGFHANRTRRSGDFPDYPNIIAYYPLQKMAQDQGFRILLTGAGSDEWLDETRFRYTDILSRLNLPALVRQISLDLRHQGFAYTHYALMRCGLRPLTPRSLRRLYRSVSPRSLSIPWITPRFLERTRLAERLGKNLDHKHFSSFFQRELYRRLVDGYAIQFGESRERVASHAGIEERHPFQDRRILEFCFAVPGDYQWFRNERKPLLRHAIKILRPEITAHRFTHVEGSPIYMDSLQSPGMQALFRELEIAAIGWVNQEAVNQLYSWTRNAYATGHTDYTGHARLLWMIWGIEIWFRRCVARR